LRGSKIKNFIKIPDRLHGKNNLFANFYRFVRFQKPTTRILGPRYVRSRRRIVLDITYQCNLHCYNCCRHCGQAPTTDRMTPEQVERFVAETLTVGYHWDRIKILGGEPSSHPDLFAIIEILLTYRRNHNPEVEIRYLTNGYGKKAEQVLAKISPEIKIDNSAKESRTNSFTSVNIAPRDSKWYRFVDYHNACGMPSHVGIALSPYGYYPCGISSGIDRVFGFDLGLKTIPAKNDDMFALLDKFCRYCGVFCYSRKLVTTPVFSPTWVSALEEYRDNPPILSRY
jgi:hypothetical protein